MGYPAARVSFLLSKNESNTSARIVQTFVIGRRCSSSCSSRCSGRCHRCTWRHGRDDAGIARSHLAVPIGADYGRTGICRRRRCLWCLHLLVHEGIDDIPNDAGGPPPAFQRGDVGPDGGTILVRQRVGEGRRYKVVPVGTGQFEQLGGVGWNIADRKSVIIGREWSRLEKL